MTTLSPSAMVVVPGWRVEELVQAVPRADGKRARPFWVGRYSLAAATHPTAELAIAAYKALRRHAPVVRPLRARAITLSQPAR